MQQTPCRIVYLFNPNRPMSVMERVFTSSMVELGGIDYTIPEYARRTVVRESMAESTSIAVAHAIASNPRPSQIRSWDRKLVSRKLGGRS